MRNELYTYEAQCISIIDGDTLLIKILLGFGITFTEKVRLYGINTPETYGVSKESNEYAKGMLAKSRLESLLFNEYPNFPKPLYIKTVKDKKDKYGRYLATIISINSDKTENNINEMLVKEGFAVPYMV